MKFLADMGISQSTMYWLQNKGYDAAHLRDDGLQAISDESIIEKAKNEKRVILTCDLDFGYLMAVSGDNSPSVIIFRLENERPANVNQRLEKVLHESSHELDQGAIVSVEEQRHRVRLLPI